jgi:hypothetical protein
MAYPQENNAHVVFADAGGPRDLVWPMSFGHRGSP